MEKGLKLGEIRKHEIDSRGLGDVYHEALKRFGEMMNEKGGAPSTEESAWSQASRGETNAVVEKIFYEIEAGEAPVSDEGALLFNPYDKAAVYRRERLQAIVQDVCWALTERTKESGAQRMYFETNFGEGCEFDMIRAGDNGELKIAGRIDRIDVLPGGRATVTDYKSGYEKFSDVNIKTGWQLQLMIYLKAVESKYEPAGVSYFRIFEPSVSLSGTKRDLSGSKILEEISKEYRSDGIVLGKPERTKDEIIENAKQCTAKSPPPKTRQEAFLNDSFEKLVDGMESEEIQALVIKTNPSRLATGEKILPENRFNEIRAEVDARLNEIAKNIACGKIPAVPKQKAGGDNVSACTWCDYLSICNYEAI